MSDSSRIGDLDSCPDPRVEKADLRGQAELSDVWRQVSRRVYATLRRRGATHDQAEDLVQDVAETVATKRVSFSDAEDLTRFAHHVARCLWIDRLRVDQGRATEVCAEIDGAEDDHAESVIESLTARRAWQLLGATDRNVLMAADERPSAPTEYGRRFRARARLLTILASLEVWLVWLYLKLRSVPRRHAVVSIAALTIVVATAVATEERSWPDPSGLSDRRGTGGPVSRRASAAPDRGNAPRLRSTDSSGAAATRYRERVSLPNRRVVIGPGQDGLVNGRTEPTTENDAVVCFGGVLLVGTRCVGDASDPLAVLAR